MKLLIDSSTQKLEDVLNVVGAMYDVRIPVPTTFPVSRNASRRGPAKRASSRKRRSGSRVSSADVRAWAQSNGYTVADRGRIPGSIIEAFLASNA